jgi:hypothetical protein
MASTRFKYDDARTIKSLQQSTDPGRWILNVPGNGANPCYMEDPQIIIQKWGGNLRTNTVNLESELRGVNRQLGRDCLGKDDYRTYEVGSSAIQYPNCSNLFTEQSRATNPAWWYRDLEQNNFEYPPINPQVNTCLPFQNNLSTRILEKDYYTPKRDCIVDETKNYLPSSYNLIRGNYVGGPITCQQTNSCQQTNFKSTF